MASCILIPKQKNSNKPSNLFQDFETITGSREAARVLWSIYLDDDLMEAMNIPVGQEPTGIDFLNKLGKQAETLLTPVQYAKYITTKENLNNKEFSSWEESMRFAQTLESKYPTLVPLFSLDNKLSLVPNTRENVKLYQKQRGLKSLNDGLMNYMESLGFTVSEVEDLGEDGRFSPMEAEQTADGLKTIIKLSKGEKGQEALPEEFSHMVVAGTKSNPITQRILRFLENNPEIIEDILGEDYERYSAEYDGNIEMLAEEAAGRLIAQNLAERASIADKLKFVGNKFLDRIASIFSKGSVSEVDSMVAQMNSDVDELIRQIYEERNIELIDTKALMDSKPLHRLSARTTTMEKLMDSAAETMAKRIKILDLRRKEGKESTADKAAYEKVKKELEKKKYASSCISFLDYALKDVIKEHEALERLEEKAKKDTNNPIILKSIFKNLRRLQVTYDAYNDIISRLAAIDRDGSLRDDIEDKDVEKISEVAKDCLAEFNSLNELIKELRFNTLAKFYQTYWNDNTTITRNGEKVRLTIEDVLESTVGDTNVASRLINSMSDMPDPLLQLVDIVYKRATADRDNKLMLMQQHLANIQKNLIDKTGTRNTDFIYERDEDGNLTGMIISNIDFNAYHKAKHAEYERLKALNLEPEVLSERLRKWTMNHTEVVVTYKDGSFTMKERLPKASEFKSNALSNLTAAQREYYDEMLQIKKEMLALLPSKNRHLYRAIQKRVDSKDALMSGGFKNAVKRLKNNFIRESDDLEYGEEVYDKGKYKLLDFSGKEVKKIPVFYTTFLDDMSELDTHTTDSMLSFCAMALNYESMNSIVDVLESTAMQMQDRDIVQTSGGRKLYERWKYHGETFNNDYVTSAADSELMKKLMTYLERNVYGKRKTEQYIGKLNVGKVGDALLRYNSLVGLGYNLFSGTTNATMGIAQTMLQATGGRFFGIKDVLKAHKTYIKEVGSDVADQYSDIKTSKMGLVMTKLDVLEEYYSQLNDSEYYGGVFKKIIGKHNPLIFNSMGEHYLHYISALALLNRQKVKVNGEEKSVYDALVIDDSVKDSTGKPIYKVKIADGTKKLDGTDFTDKDLQHLKELIQNVNHSMHGAFNQVDRGDMSTHILGRLVMQFRQWMPAFYMARFKSNRLNVVTGEEEEGMYITAFNVLVGTLKDIFQLKFNLGTRLKNLNANQKANLKMAFFEVALLYAISGLLRLGGGPDKDDPWLVGMLKYNGYRLKMELGAAAPTSKNFYDNVKTLIQSPVPAMENLDRLLSLLNPMLLGDTIETGKYKGWNRWVKDAYFAIPYARNVGRVIELGEGDTSIFTPYVNPSSFKRRNN